MSPLCMLWLGLPLLPVMSDILTIACCHNNIRIIIANNIISRMTYKAKNRYQFAVIPERYLELQTSCAILDSSLRTCQQFLMFADPIS